MLSGIRTTPQTLLAHARGHGPLLTWAALGALALALVFTVMKRTAEAQLRGDAQGAALSWAAFLTRTVPDLDLIFAGDLPSPQAQNHLLALREAHEVFRFRLFGPDGRLLLESDSLGKAPTGEQANTPNPHALRAAQEGVPGIELDPCMSGLARRALAAGPIGPQPVQLPLLAPHHRLQRVLEAAQIGACGA